MYDVIYWCVFGLMLVATALNFVSFVRNRKLHERLKEMCSVYAATLTNKEK